jgi:hypothetical protein
MFARVFDFNENDLQLNQQGIVGESQKQALDSSRKARMFSMVAYIVMFVLFLLVCLGIGISLLINREGSTTRLAIIFAMMVAMLFVGGGSANFYFRSRDVLTRKVSQMEGTAKLYTRQYNAALSGLGYTNLGTGWFIKLGSKEFRLLTAEQYEAFQEGKSYRIYYVKNYPIDVILSAEAL